MRPDPGARDACAGGPVVVDIAMFYGPRSGGIRTYLNEKAHFAAASGAFEHHMIAPGRREVHDGARHVVRSVRVVASNGYRIPLGVGALKETVHRVPPDFRVPARPVLGAARRDVARVACYRTCWTDSDTKETSRGVRRF